MSAAGVIAILVLGLLVTTIFTFGVRTKGPWNSAWTFLLVQILCLSVVSLWVPPIGPVWYGTPWIDLLITAFFIAFIMSAFTPSANEFRDDSFGQVDGKRKMPSSGESLSSGKTATGSRQVVVAGSFFWMLLLFLTVLIIVGAVD